MTKKEALLTFADDIMEILRYEITNLDKREAAPRKPTKTQVENANLSNQIAEMLEPDKMYTTAEVVDLVNQ